MSVNAPALRYHGGKFRLAKWIMQFFPAHSIYVESFGGAAGVLLQKPRSYSEVYNDLDSCVVNFFEVLRDPELRSQLIEAIAMTPYARVEFERAWIPTDDRIESARRLCIRAQMGFGSAGATKGNTGFRIDTRRKYGTAPQLWAAYPRALAAAGGRLEGVMIENRPAIDVLLSQDGVDSLHYVDPPYMHELRVMRGHGNYRHELTAEQHLELIEVLRSLSGMVVLSGYPSQAYDDALPGWMRFHRQARISAGRGASTRTECVWINAACRAALDRSAGAIFEGAAA